MKQATMINSKTFLSGMTLLELTVVILVLLSLISILFIGARAWKKGSDRAASILQIRQVQQAVRSYSNLNGKNPGDNDPNLRLQIFGAGRFIEVDPTITSHPAGGAYTYEIATPTSIPDLGELYMKTGGTGLEPASYYDPEPATIQAW
ncbi:MAG: hypothetical protein AB8D78_13135 [Akkermansiaceae bacterium]